MTHLYVMSTMNLFHLEYSFDETKSRDLEINLSRNCASSHEFRTISNIFQLKRLYRPAITIYLSSNALCYQSFALIESFNTSEMSVVSTSIDRLNETTRAKENTWGYLDRWQSIYHECFIIDDTNDSFVSSKTAKWSASETASKTQRKNSRISSIRFDSITYLLRCVIAIRLFSIFGASRIFHR